MAALATANDLHRAGLPAASHRRPRPVGFLFSCPSLRIIADVQYKKVFNGDANNNMLILIPHQFDNQAMFFMYIFTRQVVLI